MTNDRRTAASFALKLALGVTVGATVIDHVVSGNSTPGFSNGDFFSYFTNQSNVIAAVVLIVAAFLVRSRSAVLAWWRGAAVLYLLITGIVNQVLLSGGLSNPVLHIIAPVAIVVDWYVFAPPRRVSGTASLAWIAYPLLWLGYTLIRGDITGFYPYGFVNPVPGGAHKIAIYVVGIAVATLVLARILRMTPQEKDFDATQGAVS